LSLSHRIEDGICTITFDEPERGNRFGHATMQAFIAALHEAHDRRAVVLVLRAEGPDFTLGRDGGDRPPGVTPTASLSLILRANELLATFPGPSVALVQGRAMGFGSGLTLGCDIAIAAADATLGFNEVHHGLAPLVVVDYLPDHVGPKMAAELVMTGRDVPADEALRLRMVNRVVAREELAGAGEELVRHLRAQPTGALRLMKRFALDDAAGRLADPAQEAVARLAAWLQAGRPEEPV
jgi:enoyl-CoA hydratase/carnithine racemase